MRAVTRAPRLWRAKTNTRQRGHWDSEARTYINVTYLGSALVRAALVSERSDASTLSKNFTPPNFRAFPVSLSSDVSSATDPPDPVRRVCVDTCFFHLEIRSVTVFLHAGDISESSTGNTWDMLRTFMRYAAGSVSWEREKERAEQGKQRTGRDGGRAKCVGL